MVKWYSDINWVYHPFSVLYNYFSVCACCIIMYLTVNAHVYPTHNFFRHKLIAKTQSLFKQTKTSVTDAEMVTVNIVDICIVV